MLSKEARQRVRENRTRRASRLRLRKIRMLAKQLGRGAVMHAAMRRACER